MTELKDSIESFKNRLNHAEERINDLEDRTFEITQSEEQKEKRMKKSEESLQDLRDTIKRNNIHIMGIPGRQEKEKGTANIFKAIVAENMPNLGKEMNIQIHETQLQIDCIQVRLHQNTL